MKTLTLGKKAYFFHYSKLINFYGLFLHSSASIAQAEKPVFLSYGQTPTAAVIRFQALHRE